MLPWVNYLAMLLTNSYLFSSLKVTFAVFLLICLCYYTNVIAM